MALCLIVVPCLVLCFVVVWRPSLINFGSSSAPLVESCLFATVTNPGSSYVHPILSPLS